MSKQTLISILTTLVAFTPLAATAQIDITKLDNEFVYFEDYDVLALDFKINPNTNAAEILDTLTVSRQGTARDGIEFDRVVLWQDGSDEGFQGEGFDKKLGEGVLDSSVYVFDGLNLRVEGETQFFVSIDTGFFIKDKLVSFGVSVNQDFNENGKWDSGDTGIFFSNGFLEETPFPASSKSLLFKETKFDTKPPKGYIKDFDADEVNEFVAPTLPLTIRGFAKDRSNGTVTEVKVIFEDKEDNIVDTQIASQNGTTMIDWDISFSPPTAFFDGTVRLELKDANLFIWESPKYQLLIDSRTASASNTVITVENPAIIADGESSSIISLFAKDTDNEPLNGIEISFSTDRETDTLSEKIVTTDENGLASVSLTSTERGTATITASSRGLTLGTTAITVDPIPDETPDETPSEENESEQEPTTPSTSPKDFGLATGDLIKGSIDAVYYLDEFGIRHVFVSQAIYTSWYGTDFSAVQTITDDLLARIPLGDPVSFKPGSMITAPSINEVYLVTENRTLRHISSESIALELFGTDWNKQITDMSEALLFTYTVVAPIEFSSEINLSSFSSESLTITSEING